MYCGDETGAFIGDFGSHTSRFGYGGEDHPKYVCPSYVASDLSSIPASCYSARELKPIFRMSQVDNYKKPVVDPNEYLQQGDLIENWDAYEHVWQSSFDILRVRDTLKHTTGGGELTKLENEQPLSKTTPSGLASSAIRSNKYGEGKILHPLMVVDHGCSHIVNTDHDAAVLRKQRVQQCELMMETFGTSSLFIAPSPMMAAFSHGRQTCLVVDVGAGGCRVTPIVDGLCLKHAQRRSGRGGDWLGNIQWQALLDEKVELTARYRLRETGRKKKKSNNVFHRWAMMDLMYELRTSEHVTMAKWRLDHTTPFIYSNRREDADDGMLQVDGNPSYELPDGTVVDLTTTRVGKDLCRVPELFFTDDLPFMNATGKPSAVLTQHDSLQNLPLHKLVHSSLTAVGDADARKELCGNILLVGGSSLLPHMEQRLSYELTTVVPSSYKCKVLASRNSAERAYAPWIGASVLTSLGSFQQLWLSRGEYEEYGACLAVQRFP